MGAIPPAALSRRAADVYLVIGPAEVAAAAQQAGRLQKFVTAGGGLVVGGHVPGWAAPGQPLASHPLNVLLRPYDIAASGDRWGGRLATGTVDMRRLFWGRRRPPQVWGTAPGACCCACCCCMGLKCLASQC